MLAEHATLSRDVTDGERLMYFLSDFNNNGRTGPEDHAVNGGPQLLSDYQWAVAQMEAMNSVDPS